MALALLVGGLGSTVLAVQEAAAWGWDSPLTLVVLAVGVAATATFVVTQARVPDPLVDVRLLRRRAFLGDVAVNGLVQFGLLAAVLHSSLYLQDLLKFSPLDDRSRRPGDGPADHGRGPARRSVVRPGRGCGHRCWPGW